MCRAITCSTCKKPSWAGCGMHVEQVLGHVAPGDRCQCRERGPKAPAGASEPAADLRSRFTRFLKR